MSTIQIKHKWAGVVLFECKAPDGLESGLHVRHALEKAAAAKSHLRGADLRDADLRCAVLRDAVLRGAVLSGADLRGADLSDADLRGAVLRGADLSGAVLRGAVLSGADLRGAVLSGKNLIGDRPFFTIGPIGSRCDYIHAWITDAGVMIRAGCFFDTRIKFELALEKKHGDNIHAQEYRAALVLIDKHAQLWTPAVDAIAATKEAEVAV